MRLKTSFLFAACAALLGSMAPLPLCAQTAPAPRVVLISGEYEYNSMVTLPWMKEQLESRFGMEAVYLQRTAGESIPGIEAVDTADLLVIAIRRMTLPEDQLARFRNHVASGRPLVALRTSSHAFENWREFDNDVLGGNYHSYYRQDMSPVVRAEQSARNHPILAGVPRTFRIGGPLYRTVPLAAGTRPLLIGRVTDTGAEAQPVAWTHTYRGARIFYSSAGDAVDFRNRDYVRMFVNAVHWALDRPPPPGVAADAVPPTIKTVPVDVFEHFARIRLISLMDVRPARDYEAGRVPRAAHLDPSAPDFEQQIRGRDDARPIVIYGRSAADAQAAAQRLHDLGVSLVYVFEGGFDSWAEAGRPVER